MLSKVVRLDPHLWSSTVETPQVSSIQLWENMNQIVSFVSAGRDFFLENRISLQPKDLTLLSISWCWRIFPLLCSLARRSCSSVSFGYQDPLVKEVRKNSADQSFLEWFALRLVACQERIAKIKTTFRHANAWHGEVSSFLNTNQAETGFFRCIPSNSSTYEQAQSRWNSKNYEFALEEKKGYLCKLRIQVLSKASILCHNPRKRLGTAWPRSENCRIRLVGFHKPGDLQPWSFWLTEALRGEQAWERNSTSSLSPLPPQSKDPSARTTGMRNGAYTEPIFEKFASRKP